MSCSAGEFERAEVDMLFLLRNKWWDPLSPHQKPTAPGNNFSKNKVTPLFPMLANSRSCTMFRVGSPARPSKLMFACCVKAEGGVPDVSTIDGD